MPKSRYIILILIWHLVKLQIQSGPSNSKGELTTAYPVLSDCVVGRSLNELWSSEFASRCTHDINITRP